MSTAEASALPAPAEGSWIAKPLRGRLGAAQLAFAGGAVYLSMRVMDIGIDGKDERLFWIGLIVFLVLVTFILTAKVSEAIARREKPSGPALIDAAFGDQFSVEVHLVVEGNRMGRDRGVLWFSEGLMGFSGRAFSFVLAAVDIAPQWERVRTMAVKKHYPIDSIVLLGAPKDAYLFVTPLAGKTGAYRKRLYEFKTANAEFSGERHWPPLHRYAAESAHVESVVRR